MTSRRRPHGTGSLFVRNGSWYGQWRSGGQLTKRKLGAVRSTQRADGLNRREAEAELRKAMLGSHSQVPTRVVIDEAGARYLEHLRALQRKPTTLQDYRIMLDRHVVPFFGQRRLDRIETARVMSYVEAKSREGLAAKTIVNHLNFLHGLFGYGLKRGWVATNPVARVDRPRIEATEQVRFLTEPEFAALVQAIPDDLLGTVERTLYVTAATTGLRQGELVALAWRDVDVARELVHVRRAFTRGHWTSPKSRRGTRSVPLAPATLARLRAHRANSAYGADHEIVFCHPHTGRPYDAAQLRRRFKAAAERAGLDGVRFHDLRHTFGTRMAAAGAPLRSIQEWMGHSDYKTTLVYADFSPDRARERRFVCEAFGRLPMPGDEGASPREARQSAG